MKRTTSALLTGVLASGGAIVLSVAVPGVASASDCGTTVVDQNNLATLFDLSETRSAGHNEITNANPDALHVYTDDGTSQAKAAGYMTITGGVALSGATAQSNYELDQVVQSGVAPGYQLVMDMDGGDATSGYTVLVYEDIYQTPGREGTWWSTRVFTGPTIHHEGGHGSTNWGTLAEWSASFPSAQINAFGWSLGSGVQGDSLVDSITFGCNTFDFAYANQDPTAVIAADDQGNGKVVFDGTGSTDPEGETLTYLWNFGDGSPTTGAPQPTHTYAVGGTYTVTLTVTDPSGNSDSATHTMTVVAAGVVNGNHLPNTGADVLGLAAIGGLVLAGGAAGAMATRRRRASAEA